MPKEKASFVLFFLSARVPSHSFAEISIPQVPILLSFAGKKHTGISGTQIIEKGAWCYLS